MPRQRRAARAFRSAKTVREQVAQEFSNKWAFFNFDLFRRLETPEKRAAFLELFPRKFYEIFHFRSSECDKYPSSSEFGNAVFSRPDFVAFLKQNPAKEPFQPIDVAKIAYAERPRVLARARADWWLKNGWPMTEAERQWLAEYDVLAKQPLPNQTPIDWQTDLPAFQRRANDRRERAAVLMEGAKD